MVNKKPIAEESKMEEDDGFDEEEEDDGFEDNVDEG